MGAVVVLHPGAWRERTTPGLWRPGRALITRQVFSCGFGGSRERGKEREGEKESKAITVGLCVADGEHLPPALFSFFFSVAAAIGLVGGFRVDRPSLCSIVRHPSKEIIKKKTPENP